ncbi:MAG: tetratricopeptide repeat protein [Bacteroidales bacterium]|nr:tetratricopeptide repeat protein [Bacteroidales bacterium]
MATKKVNNQTENNQAVGEAVSGVELFLKKNGNLLSTILLIILIAACAIVAVNRWVIKPAQQEAKAAAAGAERYFQMGQFEQALSGDGNVLGFADIIEQYGRKAGQGVYFDAGVCQLQLKNYEEALNYLKKYNGKDAILKARALACMGDAYVGLGNNESALAQYKAAINAGSTPFTAAYLLKAGIAAEDLGRKGEALAFYEDIKVKYPASAEATDIDKYITRLNAAE